jgi:FtsP/CotA-like multicopper oxidase with cupredoxin domain
VRRGDLVDVTLANELGEDTTIHWHGMLVNERNDGSGMHPVRHGSVYVYRFPVLNRAGSIGITRIRTTGRARRSTWGWADSCS